MKKKVLVLFFIFAASTSLLAQSAETGNVLARPSDPAKLELAPIFVSDDGGLIYLRQVRDKVYWFAEHPGRGYSHVFEGQRSGNRIRGQIISVPKYSAKTVARVTMEVRPGGGVHQVAGSDKLPFRKLSPRALNEVKDRLPRPTLPAYQAQGADFDGGYKDAKDRRFYVRTIGDKVVFFVESKFARGERPLAAFVYIGTWVDENRRFSTGRLIALPKGRRKSQGAFSLGFLEGKQLSGKSDFAHLKTTLAKPQSTRVSPNTPAPSGDSIKPPYPNNWPYVQFSGNPSLRLEFKKIGDQPYTLTLPLDALPDWLPYDDEGQPILPDTACGLVIRNAGSIQWQVGESIVETGIFNAVPNVGALGSEFYNGGIQFSGPIGGCTGLDKKWSFPDPFTSGEPFEELENMSLVVDGGPFSIDFIKDTGPRLKPIKHDKLFKDNSKKVLKDHAKFWHNLMKKGKDPSDYCSTVGPYWKRFCQQFPTDVNICAQEILELPGC